MAPTFKARDDHRFRPVARSVVAQVGVGSISVRLRREREAPSWRLVEFVASIRAHLTLVPKGAVRRWPETCQLGWHMNRWRSHGRFDVAFLAYIVMRSCYSLGVSA